MSGMHQPSSAGSVAVPGRGGRGSEWPRRARAEHVTTARGAGRTVPRGGGGGESNGGRGRLRARRAAGAAAAAAEARRADPFPGRALSIALSTAAPCETAGESPSVAGTDNGQRVASLSGGAHERLLPCPGRGLARPPEVSGPRPQARRSLSPLSVRGVRTRRCPGGTCGRAATRELAESLGAAQPRAPSRALSSSRVPSAEPDLASQELGRGHAQPGPQAASLCLTSAEPMRTNSCCPSSDELPV